jgi:hypothetical protein
MSKMHVKAEELTWRKSRRSGFQGNCVELADAGDTIAVRNSRFPQGAVLAFPARDMASFLDGIKSGELDELA